MSDTNGNAPPSRIRTLDGARQAKTDDHGRKLAHNVTVLEAHEIAIEEGNKVNAFYCDQIPPFVARMIQDALLSYGLIKPIEGTDIAPAVDVTATEAGPPAPNKCPTCGGSAEPTEFGDCYYVRCTNEMCRNGERGSHPTRVAAIVAWNSATEPAP